MHSSVEALRRALPYLRLYQGQRFVVKVGGEAIQTQADAKALLEQVSVLHRLGIQVVLVHGGGPQATALADRLGAQSVFHEGRRITDAGMLEAMTLALFGAARATLLSAGRELDMPVIGLSGVDSGLVHAAKRPPRKTKDGETVDFGFVGDIVKIDPKVLDDLLDSGYLPMVSPLSADADGQLLNINADSVAAAIANAIGAAKLILVTGAPGICTDPGDPTTLISHLELAQLQELEKDGTLKDGMMPKAACIADALNGTVTRVHVISYKTPDSLLTEVFTNEGCGTMIVLDEAELMPEEV
ncbi:MAG: acetylglutamate kinase [Fimbriimonadaceae bacterium]|nr:acetylglutamate kinase [Fimbriimonadaceae bacterium]